MQDFRKLRVWHQAKDYCVAVYGVTAGFPPDERYGMTSQLRRASRSIAANIAEGCGYMGGRDSGRFYQIGMGSSNECLSDMLICREVGILDSCSFDELESRLLPVRKSLSRLILATRGQER